jgi:hypothetical protein
MTSTSRDLIAPNLHKLGTGALTTTFDEPVAPFGTSTFIIPLQ